MSKLLLTGLVGVALLLSAPVFAVDGQILINQSTVTAAGGFPYKITQPGSYKLSGSLVVPANTDGIDVNADDVTVDLNGFSITGPVTCTLGGSGISCSGDPVFSTFGIYAAQNHNVTIRNGMVRGFSYGVESSSALVEEIHATNNLTFGIETNDGIVRRSLASQNGYLGIYAQAATVTENSVDNNGSYGLSALYCFVSANTFVANGNGSLDAQIQPGGYVSGNNNYCNGTAC